MAHWGEQDRPVCFHCTEKKGGKQRGEPGGYLLLAAAALISTQSSASWLPCICSHRLDQFCYTEKDSECEQWLAFSISSGARECSRELMEIEQKLSPVAWAAPKGRPPPSVSVLRWFVAIMIHPLSKAVVQRFVGSTHAVKIRVLWIWFHWGLCADFSNTHLDWSDFFSLTGFCA